MSTMLDAALGYLAQGLSVFPVKVLRDHTGRLQKKPRVLWGQLQEALPTAEQVATWWAMWPDAAIGLALGPVSGVARSDADSGTAVAMAREAGLTQGFLSPSAGHGVLLPWLPWMAAFGSVHIMWRGEGDHEEWRFQFKGAYTVLPPTPGYEPIGHLRQEWPAELRDALLSRAAELEVARELKRQTPVTLKAPDEAEVHEALAHIPADAYEDWLRVGMALKDGGHPLSVWEEWSKKSAKHQEGACAKKWAGFNGMGTTMASLIWMAKQRGFAPRDPHAPLTEEGNAQILARIGAGVIMHSNKIGWVAWDGRCWTKGRVAAEGTVQELLKVVVETRRRAAVCSLARHMASDHRALGYLEKTKAKRSIVTKINALDNKRAYDGARGLAYSTPSLQCDHRQLDTHPELVNFQNGTFDTDISMLRPHDPADMLTSVVPYRYMPGAPRPEFEAYLQRSLPDPDVRAYLKVKLGSMLLGETRKELLIFWGPDGDNGKTMIAELMLYALGTGYAVKCDSNLLIQDRSGRDKDRDTLKLIGARFACCSETNHGARLNEAMLKELTGGDSITTRALYHEKFTFTPTHDIVYITNHKPAVSGTDEAIWGRMRLVEFPRSFPPGHPERVEGLKERLYGEAEGFLAWLVEGCVDYVNAGKTIREPDAVRASTQAYRRDNSTVARFLEDSGYASCGWEDGRILKRTVVEAYKQWCARVNVTTKYEPKWFGSQMRMLGVASDDNNYALRTAPRT